MLMIAPCLQLDSPDARRACASGQAANALSLPTLMIAPCLQLDSPDARRDCASGQAANALSLPTRMSACRRTRAAEYASAWRVAHSRLRSSGVSAAKVSMVCSVARRRASMSETLNSRCSAHVVATRRPAVLAQAASSVGLIAAMSSRASGRDMKRGLQPRPSFGPRRRNMAQNSWEPLAAPIRRPGCALKSVGLKTPSSSSMLMFSATCSTVVLATISGVAASGIGR